MENNHICLLPFYAIYYRDDYKYVSSCCMQRPFEILEDKNIKKWWTGKSVQQVRKDFINGKWPESCKICKTQSEAGQETLRDRWHNEFMFRLGASYDDLDIVYGNSMKEPVYIDYMPDNLCNLSCTMCNPGSSTQFEKMVKDLNIDIDPSTFVNAEIVHDHGFFIGLPSYLMSDEKVKKLGHILLSY